MTMTEFLQQRKKIADLLMSFDKLGVKMPLSLELQRALDKEMERRNAETKP